MGDVIKMVLITAGLVAFVYLAGVLAGMVTGMVLSLAD